MLPTGVPEYRVHTRPSLVEHWRHLVEIVALVTAAVWAFYVFVYQERIKPAGELPRIQTSTTLAHESLKGGKELVTIDATLNNTGSNDISMAALLVNAYGVSYKGDSNGEVQEIHPMRGVTIVNHGLKGSDQKLLYSHLALWQPLGASYASFRVPQGEQFTIHRSFVIKSGAYDTIRITYGFCYQRYDDPVVSVYNPKRTSDGGFDVKDVIAATGAHAGLRCSGTSDPYIGEHAL